MLWGQLSHTLHTHLKRYLGIHILLGKNLPNVDVPLQSSLKLSVAC